MKKKIQNCCTAAPRDAARCQRKLEPVGTSFAAAPTTVRYFSHGQVAILLLLLHICMPMIDWFFPIYKYFSFIYLMWIAS